jgi:hypothetical protein
MFDILFPLALAALGLAIGIPSYVTKSRRWPGMIAGFDPARCSDVDGLTRAVGGTGMMMGGIFLVAAATAFVFPQSRGAVAIVIAPTAVVGLIITTTACGRFTRR